MGSNLNPFSFPFFYLDVYLLILYANLDITINLCLSAFTDCQTKTSSKPYLPSAKKIIRRCHMVMISTFEFFSHDEAQSVDIA